MKKKKRFDGQKFKAGLKKVRKSITRVGGWIGRKLWNARQMIGLVFIGMFTLFANGYHKGYIQSKEEDADKLEERMKLLHDLQGADTEECDEIEEARDLIDEYGLDELRQAASAIEDGMLEEIEEN